MGGLRDHVGGVVTCEGHHAHNHSSFMIPVHETFLDPTFWHALGRARDWDAPCDLAITCVAGQEESWRGHGAYWMYQWHCFIQHLAQGNPPEAFFARLPLTRRVPPCTVSTPDARVHRHSTAQQQDAHHEDPAQ